MTNFKFSVNLVNNQHSVIASCGSEERLYASYEGSLHVAQAIRDTVAKDTARGCDLKFNELPLIQTRLNKKNNMVRFTA